MHLLNILKTLSPSFYQKLAIVWMLLTLWLSLISARTATKFQVFDFLGVDKLYHLIFYSIFSFLWCSGLREKNKGVKIALIFSISFGIIMEICQFYLFNGRSFELYDILANTIGSILGMILFIKFIN